MKLKKAGDGRLLRGDAIDVMEKNAMFWIEFHPFIMYFRFIESSPYRRRVVTIGSGGVEKFKGGKGQFYYWKKSIFEVLEENENKEVKQ
jgi:hypothetical protein